MNYYKQFAEMLGLELEQEFSITSADGEQTSSLLYKITKDGIFCRGEKETDGFWVLEPSTTVEHLIRGVFKAVPKPWKPKEDEKYWYFSGMLDRGTKCTWLNSATDLMLWKVGNCFKTKEEAEAKGGEIIEALLKEYEEA